MLLFRFVSKQFVPVEFYTKTASFNVLIEPKQTEDQPKQFDRKHILVFFRQFRVVSVVLIQDRKTETNQKF